MSWISDSYNAIKKKVSYLGNITDFFFFTSDKPRILTVQEKYGFYLTCTLIEQ